MRVSALTLCLSNEKKYAGNVVVQEKAVVHKVLKVWEPRLSLSRRGKESEGEVGWSQSETYSTDF